MRFNPLLPVATLFLAIGLPGLAGAQDVGFQVLFDGSSLDQWRGYHQEAIGAGWKVADGALMFDGSQGGDIITRDEFGDFELRFEWKVAKAANSGVMYKVGLGDEASYYTGPEYQILDNDGHANGKNPKTSAASLYGLYPAEDGKTREVGQWNTAKIIVNGNHVEHWLNGSKVVDVEIGSDDWNERVAGSKFKDWDRFGKLSRGHICLQDHGDQVWFRNIRIKTGNSEK